MKLTEGVDFINIYMRKFFVRKCFTQLFLRYKAKKVTRCQFHQRFYVQIFHTNGISTAFSSYVLALAKKLYKKCACLILMKLKTENLHEAPSHKKIHANKCWWNWHLLLLDKTKQKISNGAKKKQKMPPLTPFKSLLIPCYKGLFKYP